MATEQGPIEELRDLAIEPPAGFLQSIRRRLNRRFTLQQATELTWSGWAEALRHLLELITAALPAGRRSD